MRKATLTVIAFALSIIGLSAGADDWAAARVMTVFSGNGQHFVRIVPGESLGETVGFTGSPKGKWANAEFYTRQKDRSYVITGEARLRNPVAPVEAFVSDSGALLTLDNWHNAGWGEVVAIYTPRGGLVKSYKLEQLYDAKVIATIRTSVSSRWWRCGPATFVDPASQKELFVSDFRGGQFVFNLQTGKVRYEPGTATCSK